MDVTSFRDTIMRWVYVKEASECFYFQEVWSHNVMVLHDEEIFRGSLFKF